MSSDLTARAAAAPSWFNRHPIIALIGAAALGYGAHSLVGDDTPAIIDAVKDKIVYRDRIVREPTADIPVVIPTNGGMLEVATIRHQKAFSLSEAADLFLFKFERCQASRKITTTAHFTYRAKLDTNWRAKLRGNQLIVVAPRLEPKLPVAFDTGTIRKESKGCFLVDGEAVNDRLVMGISGQLARDARNPFYVEQAQSKGRHSVEQFVRKWLLTQNAYAGAKDAQIVVYFRGEPIRSIDQI